MGFEAEQNSVPGLLPLSGAIFMSNTSTMEECLTRELFGLPSSFLHFVKQVRAGMILFLFDHETRLLHGVFQACSNGALNIVPHAYRSSGRQYPAQVKMTPIWHCNPLSEDEFGDAIEENYFSAYKFRFGLSEKQVHRLLSLFDMRKLKDRPLKRQSSRNNSSSKSQCSADSKIRYIDDNRYKLKERVIDKQDLSLFDMRKLKDITRKRQSSRNNSSSTSQCSADSKIRYIDDNRHKLKERVIDKRDSSLFDMRKLKDIPLKRQSSRNNSSSTSQCSADSKIRYIDDNRHKLKERVIDKRDLDDDHVREVSEDSLRFIERDKLHKEQKVSDEFLPDISTKDYYLPSVPVGNNNTLTDIRSVRYDYDKNIERGLTPAEHSPSERFRRYNDGRIDKLVSEYIEGYDFIPLTPVEQPHLVPSDFCHDKSFLQSDQFRTTSVVHCDTESQNFIPLNLSYSGDEMEERSHFFYHNAHRNKHSLTGVGDMSMSMQKYDYAERMIPSLRNPLDSVRVNLIDRWQGDSSHSSDNLYRAKYLHHRDTGLPKILNDRTLSTSETFSSVPQLETGNNWMENKVQFISPSKYARISFCSPLRTQDGQEHQRAELDCDIEYQTSKSESFEDPIRKSVFSRLALKKSDKHIGYEEHYNNTSEDDIMSVSDDDKNLKKNRKDFSNELEVKGAFLTEKESDYPIPEETVFLDFKRRSQSLKSSDNLNPNNQTKSVDSEDISRSGQRKKRKLMRPNFHESRLFDSNSNLKVQSSEICIDKVKVETSTALRASEENKGTVPGNVELLQAGCEGDSEGRNGNSPKVITKY